MPATFTRSDGLRESTFVAVDLHAARFIDSDLSGVVMRGVDVSRADIDAPWLVHGGPVLVNGVDVVPLVDAELNRRFPGRADRRAGDPAGLRAAWAALEASWQDTLTRVDSMPAGTVDVSVRGEWSFAQTLRHLILATDAWFRRGVLRTPQPFHPIGLAGPGAEEDGLDLSQFTTATPSWTEVLEVRSERMAMVRTFLDTVSPEELDETRQNPWAPEASETVRSCLHVLLEEEWEHLRFAVRDLDLIAGEPPSEADRSARATV